MQRSTAPGSSRSVSWASSTLLNTVNICVQTILYCQHFCMYTDIKAVLQYSWYKELFKVHQQWPQRSSCYCNRLNCKIWCFGPNLSRRIIYHFSVLSQSVTVKVSVMHPNMLFTHVLLTVDEQSQMWYRSLSSLWRQSIKNKLEEEV